ncbi:putative nuclease HARBI1 [Pristis pectinata]|uniref:putative nuclease HARBI1 n=1 Tax=Pristis pectinata TaxID=685728 RepID=UPI00223D42DC|nr:putative nuclease HARBI1 [Pristis pectinata]XP_051866529.1 putative nuclease HARBI1 [Pristis pectinata]XP_051866531.1 putative nuclease HARBI1 [Pristis pectinata]
MGIGFSASLALHLAEEDQEEQERAARDVRWHRRRTVRSRRYPAHRVYRPRQSYLGMTEEQCLESLRLSREAVTELCHLLNRDLQTQSTISTALPVAVKVTTALNFYALGSFQASTGNICSVSQFAVHRSITEVTDALFCRADNFISFPTDQQQQQQRATHFYRSAGFPRVQGAIDCMHVAIRAPVHDAMAYMNHKGYYSINVQLVCDHQYRIMQVNAHFPGSSHSAFILRHSSVPALFEGEGRLEGWLLGDKEYPLQPWLMTPLRCPQTEAERRYNKAHSKTWITVEHTIRILKQRFRCLDRSRGALQYSPHKVSKMIIACCILHNFALQRGLNFEEERDEDCMAEQEAESDDEEPLEEPTVQQGRQVQQALILDAFE